MYCVVITFYYILHFCLHLSQTLETMIWTASCWQWGPPPSYQCIAVSINLHLHWSDIQNYVWICLLFMNVCYFNLFVLTAVATSSSVAVPGQATGREKGLLQINTFIFVTGYWDTMNLSHNLTFFVLMFSVFWSCFGHVHVLCMSVCRLVQCGHVPLTIVCMWVFY